MVLEEKVKMSIRKNVLTSDQVRKSRFYSTSRIDQIFSSTLATLAGLGNDSDLIPDLKTSKKLALETAAIHQQSSSQV